MVLQREVYGGSSVTEIGNAGVEEFAAAMADLDGSTINIDVEIEYQRIAGATPNAARWAGTLLQMFPQITSQGIVSIREIHGTSVLSQHSYGNAVDTFAPWDVMHDIFDFGVANFAAFDLRLLILEDVQYTGSFGHYSGVWHNHVHGDFWPQYGGTPPGHPI
jgi:hypothetical protein